MTGNGGGFWRSVRQLPGRTPLRVKLITAVLTLVILALGAISVTGIYVLKNELLGQADQTLAGYAQQIRHELAFGVALPSTPKAQFEEAVTWVPDQGGAQQLIIPSTSAGYAPGSNGQIMSGPGIPADLNAIPTDPDHAITVPATQGTGQWRVIGIPANVQNSNGSSEHGVVLIATSVTSVYRTLGRLAAIDILVSLAIILALAAIGFAVVRASLRPLTDIEETAEAIAAGDLTRRVPDRDPRTEVGRLGRSLNTMLAQIEAAFRSRARSEGAARRSEERMRQFVTDASHELRTPLTAIRGFAEYYRQRGGVESAAPAQPEAGSAAIAAEPRPAAAGSGNGRGQLQRADLDRIMRRVEQESSRMGVLVEDMLLLARMDQQRPLDRSTVDLLTLAADAVHDARVVAPERSINLTVGSGAALLVLGDEVRLRQVIGNLMSNALSHTPAGTPIDVSIRSGSLAESDKPGVFRPAHPAARPGQAGGEAAAQPGIRSAAVLEVADQGPGLTPEQAEHVFERFYRADQARTAGGTGLGLAIVAEIVAAHGGAVWVESSPGGGAVFRIALPLAPEALPDDPEPEDPADADVATPGGWDSGGGSEAPGETGWDDGEAPGETGWDDGEAPGETGWDGRPEVIDSSARGSRPAD